MAETVIHNTNKKWMSLLLIPIFCCSTLMLFLLMVSAPTSHGGKKITFAFPANIEELKSTADILGEYYKTHQLYVLLLFCGAYLYKQTFAIPGSALMNILAGALFGVKLGLPLCCLLTGIGATLSYSLSKLCLKQLVQIYLPTKLDEMRNKVEANQDNLLYFLLSMRLFPMTPNWLINITSPIVGIPIHVFFITVLFGLIPYNYLCVQSGSILSNITSFGDVITWQSASQLAVLAAVAIGPGFFRRRLHE